MKTFTKHILLLALMLFGAAGAAWASVPQKYTGPVDIATLQVGDTLAPGFSLTGITGQGLILENGRYKAGTNVMDGTTSFNANKVTGYGDNGAIIFNGSITFSPYTGTADGNAWVVSVIIGDNIYLAGVTAYIAPDPTVPALDETTGHWNFLMPGSNKVVKAVLLDSIVVGPHVSVYDATPAFAAGDIYTRGDSTIYYYDTNNKPTFHLRADEQADGKFFGYWSDLDQTHPSYTNRTYRYVSPGFLTCGHRYTAAYLDNHTLTLNANQGGTLSLDGYTPAGINDRQWTVNVSNISASGDNVFEGRISNVQISTVTMLTSDNDIVGSGTINGESGSVQIATSAAPAKIKFDYSWYDSEDDETYNSSITSLVSATSGEQIFEDEEEVLLHVIISYTSTAAATPAVLPFGVTAGADGTFNVMEGLTVGVTATPEEGFRLAQWSDQTEPVEGDARLGGSHSFTMPATDATLTATFVQNPVLTLAQADGGTVTLDGVTPGATTYNITIRDHDTYTDVTYTNVTFPFQTTVFLHEGLDDVGGDELDPVSVEKDGNNAVITINGPYGGGRTIDYRYWEMAVGLKSIFCEAVEGLPIMPEGVTYAGYDTYLVLPGTELSVTATPDSAHYLSAIDGHDTVGNHATAYTFHMPSSDKALEATFAAKPVLTLEANDGGTLEAIVPQGGALTSQLDVPSEWAGNGSLVRATENLPSDFQSVSEAVALAWQNTTGQKVLLFFGGDEISAKYIMFQADGSNSGINDDGITKTSVAGFVVNGYQVRYTTGVSKSNVTASATHNTYYIDYNTDVTVVATPDSAHYLVNFDQDEALNSNVAVEKTYTHLTADTTTVTANFAAKPVLTLAHTDGGTLTLDGYTPGETTYDITIDGNTVTNVTFPYQTTVFLHEGLQDVGSGQYPLSAVREGNSAAITISEPYSGERTVSYTYIDNENFISGHKNISCQSVESAPTMPAGVVSANATLDTFVVDYGADVTVIATPDSIHYLATLGDVTIGSNTAVDSTITLTADRELRATFAPKPTITLEANDGGTLEAIVQGGATATHLTTDQIPTWEAIETVTEADLQPFGFVAVDSAAAAAWTGAPASGDAHLIYAPEGGDQFKALAFRDGRLLDAYTAAYPQVYFYDYSDILYFTTGVTPPNVTASATPNTYYIDYNTDVTVKATPDATHYLANFDGTDVRNDNDTATKSYQNITEGFTSRANFNAKPVLTITRNQAAWGSVMLDGDITTLEGVVALTDSTYRVDYGTTVTVSAKATTLHHVAGWQDEDSTALGEASYAEYFVPEPANLFPAVSTLTFTVTADTTAVALFGINSYDATATATLDERFEGTPLLMGTVAASYFDIEGIEHSIAPDTNLSLTAQGGATTTLVAKANYGYLFKHWTVGNGIVLTDTFRITEAYDVTAVFVPDTFTVALNANDSDMGSLVIDNAATALPEGVIFNADGTYGVAYLVSINTKAVPANRCFDFSEWSNDVAFDESAMQTVKVEGDTSLTATFVRHMYTGDTTASECDKFAWHDISYTLTPAEAPTYLYTTPDECDSTVTLHLTIRHSNTGIETATACDQYTWQGTTYTESNTLDQRTLTNIEGCDSVVTLNLTVNYHHDTAYNDQADVRYEWLGEVFTENGVYVRTIETYQGCDSTITLTLAIAPYETPIPDIYHLMGAMLMINHFPEGFDSVGYIYYRWYRDGELVKEGLDADSYDEGGTLLDGCYYLEISTDANHKYWAKSNELCFNKGVGIADVETVSLAIAPNPVAKGSRVSVIVSGAADLQGAILTIYDAQGRQVMNTEMTNSNFEIQNTQFASGIYTVRVALRDGRIATKRLVVR